MVEAASCCTVGSPELSSKRAPHPVRVGLQPDPVADRDGRLVYEHAEAVECCAAPLACAVEECCVRWVWDHVGDDRPAPQALSRVSPWIQAGLAGGAAAAIWGLVEPLDRHVFRFPYSDIAILGTLVTRGPHWRAIGWTWHVANGAVVPAWVG